MIKIKCQCEENFRVSKINIINKTSITCQNCGQEMPQDILQLIKEYVNHTDNANKCLSEISSKTILNKDKPLSVRYTWSISVE